MANEISVTQNITATKGNQTYTRSRSYRADWTTARQDGQVQSIGTTHEALTVSTDVATNGWGYFTNLDATNYVELGLVVAATFYPFAKLKPGESAEFRVAGGAALYAKANTAACDLDWVILND
jgi:hypothetical protein